MTSAAPPAPPAALVGPYAPPRRTAPLSVTPLGTRTRAQIIASAIGHNFTGTNAEFAKAVRHDVAAYRVRYRTTTPQGAPTTASGLLAVPVLPQSTQSTRGTRPLPTVLHTHGSMTFKGRAPSVAPQGPDGTAAQVYAAGGRAVLVPDYLGLGESPDRHPFMHNASAVSVTLDLLASVRTLRQLRLSDDVYVTGFSQGGQAGMAVAREIASGAVRHVRLRGLRTGSGPYDLEHAELPAMANGSVPGPAAVILIAYVLTAQKNLTTPPLYRDPAEVFRAPYASRVESLFDGTHKEEEIIPQLPPTLQELLTPAWYAQLTHPTGTFLRTVRTVDTTCAWRPEVPVTLYSATGDHESVIANTRSCARQLTSHGTRSVTVIDHGPTVDHFGVFQHSMLNVATSFPHL
ncbi:alpha/beta hydrolase [Streptomyces sp. NPDC087440]|uniref:alpha/beta hydrolase n=1 Tax=Streptomyces sp. NPDC087440 TaxID=3365790 RepID=UPI00381100D2